MTVIYNAKIAKAMSGGDIDTSKFAASIAYYKATTAIQLKNEDGEVISSMDASDFIVDGMVEDVEIVDGNLVISFNTDAGKSDISIPISVADIESLCGSIIVLTFNGQEQPKFLVKNVGVSATVDAVDIFHTVSLSMELVEGHTPKKTVYTEVRMMKK